jgi:genome maintenance exonuclease 1
LFGTIQLQNRKSFRYDPISFNLLEREEIDGIRYYKTPTGLLYPSVTTVLGAMSDKSALEAWKKRVGPEEAARVSAFASTRGTNVHTMCEKYVLGEDLDMSMPGNVATFRQLKKVLDDKVNNIRATECTLISHHLKTAGTCDLIADYDGRLSIIDYKTSAKVKRKEWIEGYFLQASLYSYMLWEMTKISVDQIVVIIAVDDNPTAQPFIERPKNFILKASQMVKDYHIKFQ